MAWLGETTSWLGASSGAVLASFRTPGNARQADTAVALVAISRRAPPKTGARKNIESASIGNGFVVQAPELG
ncbi:MAG: hypothetical protein WA209_11670, partial [Candidatus Acidiferrales bacterium]